MKTKIRKSVFETNSSSTHSICVAKNNNTKNFYKLSFWFGEFGWEEDKLNDPQDKMTYLVTALFNVYEYDFDTVKEYVNRMSDWLKSDGLLANDYHSTDVGDAVFGKTIRYEKIRWILPNYKGIDHANDGELKDFVDFVCGSKDILYRYLFNDDSFVLTGNDNGYENVDIEVDYPHDEFYKGN